MGKAAVMSLLERQKVDFLHSQGLSHRNIAKQINRSSRTVDRYLKDSEAYGNNFKRKKKTLSKQAERHIVRIASNSTKSAAKIKEFADHDLRKDELYLSRHHRQEGGIMVWGAITFYGTIVLIFIDQKMNDDRFKTMLESVFPKLKYLFGSIPWIF